MEIFGLAYSSYRVAVTVISVVIALALMTGLQGELRDRILGSMAHVYVWKTGGIVDYEAEIGKVRRIDDAAGRYIEFCKSTFPGELDLKGLKLVVDSAHGATYHIAQHVFHELGADVIPIGNEPDGFNINDRCGATHPQALQEAVKRGHADLGIALDGDEIGRAHV